MNDSDAPKFDNDERQEDTRMRLRPSDSNVTEDQEPFMGVKVRRKASRRHEYKGDYMDIPSRPYLMKILQKQGYLTLFVICSVKSHISQLLLFNLSVKSQFGFDMIRLLMPVLA
ncbi:hypothetical protein Gohar_005816 [Gossypium harknessii]|uniref:Uncharacterized protein n=1 Tax=Gossypium harknessii TaxID=34285 RepID=A0A7J9H9C5_9ROSI|nr:hypothetical protein [Gossypium harknessii]